MTTEEKVKIPIQQTPLKLSDEIISHLRLINDELQKQNIPPIKLYTDGNEALIYIQKDKLETVLGVITKTITNVQTTLPETVKEEIKNIKPIEKPQAIVMEDKQEEKEFYIGCPNCGNVEFFKKTEIEIVKAKKVYECPNCNTKHKIKG